MKCTEMKLSDVFPSNYLKAEDLQDRNATVAIREYKMEKMGDDTKLVLYFRGKEKGMVCNKTNAELIAFYYGDDLRNWIGNAIIIGVEPVTFQGKVTKAIRVKGKPEAEAPAPAAVPAQVSAPAPVAAAPFDDEIPF